MDVLKFVLAFLMIIKSLEYTKKWKIYVYQLIEVCKDIFFAPLYIG
jgi:hypothetical protein